MAWARIHDGAMSHPKIMALSDGAFRVWVKGLAFSQLNLTDGLIPRDAVKQFGATKRALDELTTPVAAEYAPLWEPHAIGYAIHDYLSWNDSREHVQGKRDQAKRRKEEWERKRRDELRSEQGSEQGSQRVPERVLGRVTNARHSTPLHDQDPPVVPPAGGRVTRADRKQAKEIREKSWGRCQHEPRCESYQGCVEVIALDLSHRRLGAAS